MKKQLPSQTTNFRQVVFMMFVLSLIFLGVSTEAFSSTTNNYGGYKKNKKRGEAHFVYKRAAKNVKSSAGLSFGKIFSQNIINSFGFSAAGSLTTSSHGLRYPVGVFVGIDQVDIEVGTFAGYQSRVLSGAQFSVKYNFVENEKVRVYAFCQFLHEGKASLTQRALEGMYGTNATLPSLSYSTNEEYVGLGISKNLGRCLAINASVGFGAYQSKNNGEEIAPINTKNTNARENKAFAFASSFGISLRF